MSINAAKAKDINRSYVLNIIRKTTNPSRQEIADLVGLSAPAVGNLVAELIRDGLVYETGRRQHQQGQINRGQPAIELGLCANGAFALGIFLEVNELSGALVNLAGEVQAQKRLTLAKLPSPEEALSLAISLTNELLDSSQKTDFKNKCLGIGLATFGPLDLEAGQINAPQHADAWINVPLRDQLAEATGLTVYLDNDATAAAIGEHWYGAGQDYPNYLYVHLTDGLGGGLFLNGSVYRGGSLNAAEFGHMLISHEGKLKFLEDVVSIKAFAKRLNLKNPLLDLEAKFEARDKDLLTCLNDAAQVLAHSIVTADHLLDLDAVILGGQVSQALLQYLLEQTQKLAKAFFMKGKPRHSQLILGQAGQDSAVLGAATLPLYDAFSLPARMTGGEHVFSSLESSV